eukprot:Seg4416.5 transcript_id=Seg4416.5/GoldUCD/mRNA.D3Y31 product="hypothetical protein" protein_id=Seg4416.5/GoldUCD/D3Y31
MVLKLLDILKEFKPMIEFNNFDFNADKPRQYNKVRGILRRKLCGQSESFGPDSDNAAPEEKNKIYVKTAYKRVMEKIKELQTNFLHALTGGSRRGSGKLVLESYFEL